MGTTLLEASFFDWTVSDRLSYVKMLEHINSILRSKCIFDHKYSIKINMSSLTKYALEDLNNALSDIII